MSQGGQTMRRVQRSYPLFPAPLHRRGLAEMLFHRGRDDARLGGLGNVAVAACLSRLELIRRQRMRRERDDRNVRGRGIRLEPPRRFPAVDDGNGDVHENEAGMSRLGGVDASLSVARLDHVKTCVAQDGRVNDEVVLVVLDEKYGLLRGGHRSAGTSNVRPGDLMEELGQNYGATSWKATSFSRSSAHFNPHESSKRISGLPFASKSSMRPRSRAMRSISLIGPETQRGYRAEMRSIRHKAPYSCSRRCSMTSNCSMPTAPTIGVGLVVSVPDV